MATSLKLTFDGGGDKRISMTFPHADASATPLQVKNLMQRIVADGTIYAEAPAAIVGAEFVDRTVYPIDLA